MNFFVALDPYNAGLGIRAFALRSFVLVALLKEQRVRIALVGFTMGAMGAIHFCCFLQKERKSEERRAIHSF